jgi:hypothetical protein
MTQPKCGKCNTLNLPGFPCSTCDPAAFERHRAAFNGMTVGDIAPRKTGPYSAKELDGLRALTEHHDPTGMTRRLLATLDDARAMIRDQHAWIHKAIVAMDYGRDDGRWSPGTHVIDALVQERNRLLVERDEARAENLSIRTRATRAHEAAYRAMNMPAEDALAALQDDGDVHRAIHEIFCGPDGTAAYPLDEAIRAHIGNMEKRAVRAESERDEAMALLRESQRLTGEATQQALDSAVRLGKMADAVRALLADVESQHGEQMDFCNAPRCRRLAMYNDGDMAACDEHQGILVAGDIEGMSYAPFVRTLRAMIEGKPGEPCGAVERLKVENEALRAALASDGEAMANLCGLLGLTDAVVSREEGQQMVHAAVKKLKVERDEMRSAARALLAELDKEARSCGKCYRLATVAEGLPRGGFVFACDKHATPPSTEWQDDPCQNYPTNVAAPLRTLRALLADPSTR